MKWRIMFWDVAGRCYVGRADVETQTQYLVGVFR